MAFLTVSPVNHELLYSLPKVLITLATAAIHFSLSNIPDSKGMGFAFSRQ